MKAKNIVIIIACVCLLVGIVLLVVSLKMADFDISKLSTEKINVYEKEISGEIKNIDIDSDITNITITPSNDDRFYAECSETERAPYTFTEREGTLYITAERTNFDFGVNFYELYINIHVPKGVIENINIESDTGTIKVDDGLEFQDVKLESDTGVIKMLASAKGNVEISSDTGSVNVKNVNCNKMYVETDTGSITVNNIIANDLELSVETGSVTVNDYKGDSINVKSSTGSVKLNNVVVLENMDVRITTGSVTLEACDAENIDIETTTGSIKGTLLSEKIFAASSNTGKVEVPFCENGGKCRLKTNTGSIKIEIVN